jgi:Holliday junction resolvase RusA-like endonuclease
MVAELQIRVPGEPKGQARHRSRVAGYGAKTWVQTYEAPEAREYKGVLTIRYEEALAAAGLRAPFILSDPVEVVIEAVFELAKSHWRKTAPLPRRPKVGKPDPDNVAKAFMDAANGILWGDDSQVARLVVERWTGAQGEAPYTLITVRAMAVPVAEKLPRAAAAVAEAQGSLL